MAEPVASESLVDSAAAAAPAVVESFQSVKEWLALHGTEYGLKLIGSIAILVIGRWVARALSSGIRRLLEKRKLDPMICGFIGNIAYALMLIFLVIGAIQNLQVPTASFVAVLGAAGLAVGLALQGSLANFASGFIMIVLRPFRKGDYVEAGGTAGIVQEIQVFSTVLVTPDNRRVIVPNAKITSDNIINYSALPTRRLDLVFGVSYGDPIPKVKEILQRVASQDARILKDPAPQIMVSEMADSSVNFILRIWMNTSDYWAVKFDTTEKVKMTFDAEGVTIPFPQRDVHLFQK
jgi:small conductance mechanosensitive channel